MLRDSDGKKLDARLNMTQSVFADRATLQHQSGCVVVLIPAGGLI